METPISGIAVQERLTSEQVAIIDKVGSSLVPPATDAELLDVRIAMNEASGELAALIGHENEKLALDATEVIAGIAYAALRMESEG